jgi:hypothetical protein
LKESKPVYLYDEITKEYIFYSKNQKNFAMVLGRSGASFSRYTKGG